MDDKLLNILLITLVISFITMISFVVIAFFQIRQNSLSKKAIKFSHIDTHMVDIVDYEIVNIGWHLSYDIDIEKARKNRKEIDQRLASCIASHDYIRHKPKSYESLNHSEIYLN